LLFTGYPTNTLGEIEPGSTSPDKTVDLTASGGVASSVGSVQFAPNGDFKIASYSGGGFYTAPLTADGSGTYNVGAATLNSTPGGGPEGLFYVPTGSPGFLTPSMLMAQYSSGLIEAFSVDGSDDPIVASGQQFVTGISGAEGGAIDPVTGDFLFATFGAGNHIDVVTGFAAPPPAVPEPSYLIFASAGLGLIIVGRSVRRKRNA